MNKLRRETGKDHLNKWSSLLVELFVYFQASPSPFDIELAVRSYRFDSKLPLFCWLLLMLLMRALLGDSSDEDEPLFAPYDIRGRESSALAPCCSMFFTVRYVCG